MSVKSVSRAVRDHLLDNSGVTDIVGDKVRESWSHHDQLPFVTIDGPHTSPEHHQTAATGWVESRLDIDCWEESRGKAEALSTAVREALYRKAVGTMGDEDLVVRSAMLVDGPEAMDQSPTDGGKTGPFRDRLDFSVWHEQSVPTPS